jgi:hypothetical protein
MGEPLTEPLFLVCEECRLLSDEDARGWIALLAEDVDGIEPMGVAIFCPNCARGEFEYGSRDDERMHD